MLDERKLILIGGAAPDLMYLYVTTDSLLEVEDPEYWKNSTENRIKPGNIFFFHDSKTGMASLRVVTKSKFREGIEFAPMIVGPLEKPKAPKKKKKEEVKHVEDKATDNRSDDDQDDE